MASNPTWAATPADVATLPRTAIHDMIEELVRRLDDEDGDPDCEEIDLEDSFVLSWIAQDGVGAGCPISDPGGCGNGDEQDVAWRENPRGGSQISLYAGADEDTEDDDADQCLAADDDLKRKVSDALPGSPDDAEDGYDREDSRDDLETEQMLHDVPSLRTYSLEFEPFTNTRQYLGLDNLQPSFIDNGGGARCASTGRVQYRNNLTGEVRHDRPWPAEDLEPKNADSSSAAAKPRPRGPDDDHKPEDCPDVYASTARGDCLAPVYEDGVCLVFSKVAPFQRGDYVGLWFRPGVAPPGESSRMVKRLVYGLPPGMELPYNPPPSCGFEPLVVVEMLNPPKQLTFRASQLLAIHKVIGKAVRLEDGKTYVDRSLIEWEAEADRPD